MISCATWRILPATRFGHFSASLLLLLLAAGVGSAPRESSAPLPGWPLWESYAARFIDGQGRVIDPQGGARTTSEGQAYALFFALVANDQLRFDRVLQWNQVNLAQGDLGAHLPAWLWGRSANGEWKRLDANSAADADLWMAYTLVEAGRLWSRPDLTALGRHMMTQIAATEVADLPGFGPMLLPGAVGFQHQRSWTLNPSYLPLFLFDRLAEVDPSGPWQQIAQRIPRLLRASERGGFAMDWIEYAPGSGFRPALAHPATPGQAAEAPVGSYDAIRVYLWAGMLEDGKLRGEMLGALPGMRDYLAHHDAPPEKISDQGVPLPQAGPVGFSAALLPYLLALSSEQRQFAQQSLRLSAERNVASGLYGRDAAYYDQNLALFATGFIGGKFRFGPGGELKVEWKRG